MTTVAARVLAHEAGEGAHPALQALVVLAGDGQAVDAFTHRFVGEGPPDRGRLAAHFLGEELHELLVAASLETLQIVQGDLRLRLARAAKAEDRRSGAERRVVEQALVHVADLLDVEGAEAEAAGLGRSAAGHSHLQHLESV
jgi:hypothetical protein